VTTTPVSLYRSATEYTANTLTILRGTAAGITSVGVFHTTDPAVIPDVGDFTTVTLADGTKTPPDPLSVTGQVDVLALIGPRDGDVELDPGDYQRYVLIQTATEDIIRRADTITIL
jgi:hypothetical protein